MVRNEKSSVSSLQNEHHRQVLTALLREEGNRRCADCHSRGPSWASVNLGVFVCLNCSGIHRSLGVHNSKVRSTNLDTWLPEQVAFVQAMGNVRGNAYWEENLPRDFRRPAEADMAALRAFITDKYVHRLYAAKGYSDPPSNENYQTHPYLRQFEAGSSAAAAPSAAPSAGKPPAAAVAATPPPPPSAPVQHFDLLSLDDDSPPAAASVAAPVAASWDPFAAHPPPTNTGAVNGGAFFASAAPAARAALVDPFAEIERSESKASRASSSSASMAAIPLTSMLSPTPPSTMQQQHFPISPAPVMPPPSFRAATAAAAPLPAMAPSPSPMLGGNGGGPTPMRTASSGSGSMRVPSGSLHTKGGLSHDDILAMFDKPQQPAPSPLMQQRSSSGFGL